MALTQKVLRCSPLACPWSKTNKVVSLMWPWWMWICLFCKNPLVKSLKEPSIWSIAMANWSFIKTSKKPWPDSVWRPRRSWKNLWVSKLRGAKCAFKIQTMALIWSALITKLLLGWPSYHKSLRNWFLSLLKTQNTKPFSSLVWLFQERCSLSSCSRWPWPPRLKNSRDWLKWFLRATSMWRQLRR